MLSSRLSGIIALAHAPALWLTIHPTTMREAGVSIMLLISFMVFIALGIAGDDLFPGEATVPEPDPASGSGSGTAP